MPAYNFAAQFAGAVENGTKRQTIRRPRTHPTMPGQTLYLYTGMRTKSCRQLDVAICKEVRPVIIEPVRLPDGSAQVGRIWINNIELSLPAKRRLAIADGFASISDMMDWFAQTYTDDQLQDLVLIRW